MLLFQNSGCSSELLIFELGSGISFPLFVVLLKKVSRLLAVMTNRILVLVFVIVRWLLTLLLELGDVAFSLLQI